MPCNQSGEKMKDDAYLKDPDYIKVYNEWQDSCAFLAKKRAEKAEAEQRCDLLRRRTIKARKDVMAKYWEKEKQKRIEDENERKKAAIEYAKNIDKRRSKK